MLLLLQFFLQLFGKLQLVVVVLPVLFPEVLAHFRLQRRPLGVFGEVFELVVFFKGLDKFRHVGLNVVGGKRLDSVKMVRTDNVRPASKPLP